MNARLVTGLFLIAGLINFAPLAGVFGDQIVASAYGINVANAELSLLLRHRAVLFGIVGGLLLVAAFRPTLRPTATICGFSSMISFAGLYLFIGPTTDELAGVFRFDLVGIAALGAGWFMHQRSIKKP